MDPDGDVNCIPMDTYITHPFEIDAPCPVTQLGDDFTSDGCPVSLRHIPRYLTRQQLHDAAALKDPVISTTQLQQWLVAAAERE